MRKLDHGHLTKADRATLNQQQNQLSKDIYKQKHEAQVQNRIPRAKWVSVSVSNRSASPRA
jgi:hypothetical protein